VIFWSPFLHLLRERTLATIIEAHALMQDSDRSLLDWVVIFSRRLKADGQRAPWNYPANIAGAALPLS
jgi:hypothetical protein